VDDATYTPDRQFVWGLRYIDDLILRDRSFVATLDERLYALQDANWNVVGFCDDIGAMQQRIAYSPYGLPTWLNIFFDGGDDDFQWETLYCGYRWDGRNDGSYGLYLARMRYLHSVLGVWIIFDPIGFGGGLMNLSNYSGTSPLNRTDPSGNQTGGAYWYPPSPKPIPNYNEPTTLTEIERPGGTEWSPWERISYARLEIRVREWRNKGWDLAADLLEHFLFGRATGIVKTPYDVSIYAVKVMKDGQFYSHMVREFNQQALRLGQGPHPLKAQQLEDVHFWEGELFWAFGGARVTVDDGSLVVQCVDNELKWKFTGTVRVFDSYSFKPTGFLWHRLWFSDYAAANQLEVDATYPKFLDQMRFSYILNYSNATLPENPYR
jgi:RHS repeat-associated protein